MVIALVLALVVMLTGLLVPTAERSALGASVTATVISGSPGIRTRAGVPGDVSDGMVIHVGDALHTGPGDRLVLNYFDGSTAEIEPNTELIVEDARIEFGGATLIRMRQVVGRTWHVVAELLRERSRYEVRTPAATAAVRGTSFEVQVNSSGETRIITTEGAVWARDLTHHEVLVTSGHETTIPVDAPPREPEPTPPPERSTRVELTTDTLVIDAAGRANGISEGRVVLQTPGARIERDNERMTLILPTAVDAPLAVLGSATDSTVTVTVSDAQGQTMETSETLGLTGLIFVAVETESQETAGVAPALEQIAAIRQTIARLGPVPSAPSETIGALNPGRVIASAGLVAPPALPARPSVDLPNTDLESITPAPPAIELPIVVALPSIPGLLTPPPAPDPTTPAPSAAPTEAPTTSPAPTASPSPSPTPSPSPSPPPTPSPSPTFIIPVPSISIPPILPGL